MAYPTFREDFEASSSLPSTVMDVQGSTWSVNTTAANAFTGNNSATETGSHALVTVANDSLGGQITASVYFRPVTTNPLANLLARGTAGDWGPNNCYSVELNNGQLMLKLHNASVATTLAPPSTYTTATFAVGTAYLLELRCGVGGTSSSLSCCLIRQSDGASYGISGSAWAWLAGNPSRLTGTDSTITGAGRVGIVGGATGAANCYFDDIIYGPAVPAIDVPSFTLASSGATQQLTAGGFTDPLDGVTWSSSNGAVESFSTTCIVTAVGNGTATITSRGKRDTTQTATATATVTMATTATLSGPTSGLVGNASTNFAITLDQPAGPGGVACTVTSSVGADTITPSSINIAQGLTVVNFTITPGTVAARTISLVSTIPTLTIAGSPITYNATGATATGYTFAGPTGGYSGVASGTYSVQPNGVFTGTITITPAGGGLATPIQLTYSSSASVQTFTITPTATGNVTLTPTNSGTLANPAALLYVVTAAPPMATYLSAVGPFTAGLATVGYTIRNPDGSVYSARTTTGVHEVPCGTTSTYQAALNLPAAGSYSIYWDDGQSPANYAQPDVANLAAFGAAGGGTAGGSVDVKSFLGVAIPAPLTPGVIPVDLYSTAGKTYHNYDDTLAAVTDAQHLTLGSTEPTDCSYLVGQILTLVSGACAFQGRVVTAATGRVVTLDRPLTATPAPGDQYLRNAYAGTTVSSLDTIVIEPGLNLRQAISLLVAEAVGGRTVTPDVATGGSDFAFVAAGGGAGAGNRVVGKTDSAGNRNVTSLSPPT